MSPLLAKAAARSEGGGAPLDQIAIVAAATTGVTLLMLLLIARYRAGGAKPLRALSALAERTIGIPGWAAVPGISTVAFATIIILGATWDIGLHIDVGRDEGPLGTTAHYPLLVGLFGVFQMGLLAIGMAPKNPARSSPVALRIRGLWPLPAGGVLLLAGGAFGFAAFPLDDLWHRTFGQDVTLWGPTHLMIVAGTAVGGTAGVLLLVEGARSVGREPANGKNALMRPLPALLAAIFLYLWAASLHEFNWGVPQYRMVWHPLLLALGAGQALVLARIWGGRGSALLALAIWAPMQVFMSLMIGGPLEVTAPGMPLFVVEVLIVELLAIRGAWRSPVRFGAVAGVLIGTVGFASEYAWTHAIMPIPWTPAMLPEGVPVAILAGVAGGVLGALMAQALQGTLAPSRRGPVLRRPLVVASAAGLLVIALGVNAFLATTPKDARVTMALSNLRQADVPGTGGPQTVGDLRVSFSNVDTEDAMYVSALGWQGKGRYLDDLRRQGDGSYVSTSPVPLTGTWKSFVRVQEGRTMLSAPIRMAADPAIAFGGFPARAQVTRPMVADRALMQIERKPGVATWLWTAATLTVLLSILLMIVLLAAIVVRVGRMQKGPRRGSGGDAARAADPVAPGRAGRRHVAAGAGAAD
ncbi:hypothetical protein [Patulibacter sp.]|uniref:hypothetical protein n=1 Tax=Patulibacter sp. TaxID=1912859 RepID=UPI00271880BF|nr:hypothetical protein [Patulibacter sp.]MDO9409561.1 hypothetical protein [Patulibacter sp.]